MEGSSLPQAFEAKIKGISFALATRQEIVSVDLIESLEFLCIMIEKNVHIYTLSKHLLEESIYH